MRGKPVTPDLFDPKLANIDARVGANFDLNAYGGSEHHLTLVQDLERKGLVTLLQNQPVDVKNQYPTLIVPPNREVRRMIIRLSMFGRWFAVARHRQIVVRTCKGAWDADA